MGVSTTHRGRSYSHNGRFMTDARFESFYAVVRSIPYGCVLTYGEVARRAGWPRRARLVGRALAALADGSDVPWHRVVNASGRISPRGLSGSDELQRWLLEEEGVVFSDVRIDLQRFGWPEPTEPAPTQG